MSHVITHFILAELKYSNCPPKLTHLKECHRKVFLLLSSSAATVTPLMKGFDLLEHFAAFDLKVTKKL